MKFLKYFLIITLSFFFMQACQKEYSLEDDSAIASGTLKADGFGDCLPSVVIGIYKIDSTLGANNFIEVQVNITSAGNYEIVSDTVNGYSFKAADNIALPGLYSVRLYGTGKPLNAGINNFTVSFGSSQCDIAVTVVSAATNIGVFTLGGSPGNCSGVTINGTYTAGISLNSTNTATLTVNVTAIGAYTLAAASTNGIFFTGSGTFTTLGPQSVILNALGTPIAEGIFNITAINLTSTCTFSVTVLPAAGSTVAVCTLGGAPSNCTGVLLSGIYQVAVAATVANTATLDVNVTTIGTYTITTPTLNGVSFSATGSFTTTGPQTVILTATGLPTAAGPINYPATVNSSTCTFSVTYIAAAPPAVYTLQGAPGVCTAALVNGTYAVNSPLTAGNTVTIQANVTTIGSYTITTNTVNGMTFSALGVFSVTGVQPIVLIGLGTPVASGTNTFTPIIGSSSCTFNIIVATAATDFITCKINGAFTTFNVNASAVLDVTSGFPVLSIDGETTASPDPAISFGVAKITAGNIVAGTYTVNQLASNIIVGCYYYDATAVEYSAETDPANQAQSPVFTIVITSITATRVTGTFTGPLKDNAGAGPGLRTVTEGAFNVPIL